MQLLPIRVLTAWWAAQDRLHQAARQTRDERGELTGNVILLAALAVAAAAVGAIIVAKLNSAANSVPGG
jgi:hypothetical protein